VPGYEITTRRLLDRPRAVVGEERGERGAAEDLEPVGGELGERVGASPAWDLTAGGERDGAHVLGHERSLVTQRDGPRLAQELGRPRVLRHGGVRFARERGICRARNLERASVGIDRPRDHERVPGDGRAHVVDDHHRVHLAAVEIALGEAAGAGVPGGTAVEGNEHERLVALGAFERPGELQQDRGARRARRAGSSGGVARRHHHDLPVGQRVQHADHVRHACARAVEVSFESIAARLEPHRPEALFDQGSEALVVGAARQPVGIELQDARRVAVGDVALESVRRDRGGERRRPLLEREHHDQDRDQGDDEGRAVDAQIHHVAVYITDRRRRLAPSARFPFTPADLCRARPRI
jgi:hypothetical protein